MENDVTKTFLQREAEKNAKNLKFKNIFHIFLARCICKPKERHTMVAIRSGYVKNYNGMKLVRIFKIVDEYNCISLFHYFWEAC